MCMSHLEEVCKVNANICKEKVWSDKHCTCSVSPPGMPVQSPSCVVARKAFMEKGWVIFHNYKKIEIISLTVILMIVYY